MLFFVVVVGGAGCETNRQVGFSVDGKMAEPLTLTFSSVCQHRLLWSGGEGGGRGMGVSRDLH